MLKLFLLFIFPAILIAGDVTLSLSHNDGSSSYTVQSNDTQNLKSTLNFPFEFNTIGLEYKHDFRYLQIVLSYSSLLNYTTEIGKDYDWKNQDLTVFSKSESKIEKYNNFNIAAYKSVYNNLDMFVGFGYSNMNIGWYNTYQTNYVSQTSKKLVGKTLQFNQEFYKYEFGLNYEEYITDNLLLNIQPSILYVYVNTKDEHTLRNFYTVQNINTLGYKILLGLKYKLTDYSSIKILYNYEEINENKTDMKYYNSSNVNYITLPSSYNYKENKINISYVYKF